MKKYFLIISIFISFLFSASIDKRLFEEGNLTRYYDTLLKKLDEDNATSKDIVALEKQLIYKIKKAINFSQTKALKLDLPEKISNEKEYLEIFNEFAKLKNSVKELEKDISTNRLKLSFYRNKIENITSNEKDRELLYQLQYAFYKIAQKNLQKELSLYKKELDKNMPNLLAILSMIKFDERKLKEKIEDLSFKLKSLYDKLSMLDIEIQNAKLKNDKTLKRLEKKESRIKKEIQSVLKEKIDKEIILSFAYLKKRNKDGFFNIFDKINDDIDRLNPEEKPLFSAKKRLLFEIAKERFGSTTIALTNTAQTLKDSLQYLISILNKPLFIYNDQAFSIVMFIKIFLILSIGFLIGKIFQSKIKKLEEKKIPINRSSLKIIGNIGYYLIVFITFFIALNSMGLNLSSLSLIAGALSVGIGFGLQTIVSNLAAGIILMSERSIRIGDYIELDENLRGRVDDIKMRSTVITTNDNINIVVPNSTFIQNNVINWTLENDIRRLHVPFSVAYGTKIEDVEKAILTELSKSSLPYFKYDKDKKPEIWMIEMADSGVNYELIVWVYGESTKHPFQTKSKFLKLIYSALYKYDIEIPFPQLDLHVKDLPSKKV